MIYNDRGLVEQIDNDEGTIHYQYDQLGRQISVAFSSTGFQPVGNDLYENLTEYTYDEIGRLKTVSSVERNNELVDLDDQEEGNQPDITSYAYDLFGNLDTVAYSNQLVHDYDYDDLNRLDYLKHFKDENRDAVFDEADGDELLTEFDYVLRDDGRRTQVTETYHPSPGTIGVPDVYVYQWDYDDLGRLESETRSVNGNESGSYTMNWTFDLTGNRLSQDQDFVSGGQDTTTTYSYDANDRLVDETIDKPGTFSDQFIQYDFVGTQQTSKTTQTNGSTSEIQEFEYNERGRMELVKTTRFAQFGGPANFYSETSYEYDSQGNRIATEHRVASDGNPSNLGPAKRTEFLTDDRNHTGYSQVLQEIEYDDQGTEVKRVIYTVGHDQLVQTVVDPSAQPEEQVQHHYFGYDGHGSVRALYGLLAAIIEAGSSNIRQQFHFDAYGNLLDDFNATDALTSYLYSGESFDKNINQQYLRARWYDATTGRFNRLDPFFGNLQDPQSLHKYAYVHGDPIQGIDPSGELLAIVFGGLRFARSLANTYIGRQAGISLLQTGLEGMAIQLMNYFVFPEDPIKFNFGRQYAINFGSNLISGGIRNFFLRNLVDTIFLTAVDVAQGQNVYMSILGNGLAAFGGELAFAIAARLFKKLSGIISSNAITKAISNFKGNKPNRINDFSDGAGFSGVFDEETKEFIAYASGSTTLSNGNPPLFYLVDQLGGHFDVNQVLSYLLGKNSTQRLGFSMVLDSNGKFAVGFNSRTINNPNSSFDGRTVPREKRQQIIDAIQRATGREAYDSSI